MSILKLCTICILYGLFFALQLTAQEYIVQTKHFSIENGLSHRDVQCTYQDEHNFIWFGTKYGLNRFDGVKFKWYTKENNGLQANEINHILGDVDGSMWLISTGSPAQKQVKSIDIFDPITEKTQAFETVFGNKAPFKSIDVVCFTGKGSGNFIFLTQNNTLVRYNKGQFTSIPIQLPEHEKVNDLHWSPTNLIWMVLTNPADPNGTSGKAIVLSFDIMGKEVRRFVHNDFEFALIYDLDEQGNCKYTTSQIRKKNRFFKISPDGQQQEDKVAEKLFDRNGFVDIPWGDFYYVGRQGSLYWAAGGNNASRSEFSLFFSDTSKQLKQKEGSLDPISDVTNVYTDKNELIWVSTQFGIYLIRLKINLFSKILYSQRTDKKPTRAITTDNAGNLWIVEENRHNLWTINSKTGKANTVNKWDSIQTRLPFPNYYIALFKAKSGYLYYQAKDKLVKFNPANFTYETLPLANTDAADSGVGTIWSIYEDKQGKIWFGTDNGNIGYWNGTQTIWISLPGKNKGVSITYQFLKDKDDTIWLATDGGLLVLDTKSGIIQARYWAGGKGEYKLPYDNILHLNEDRDGSFWIGTSGTGLIHWNKGKPLNKINPELAGTSFLHPSGLCEQFTTIHGLSNNVIYAVYPDEFNNLWLPSDYGLMRFSKSTHRVQTYRETDGITHNEFNRISHFQAADGTLYFGGLNGITVFNPNDFQDIAANINLPLVITDYQQYDVNGNISDERKLTLLQNYNIVMQPADRLFRLEFMLLNYDEAERNHYAYKIQGIDKDWRYQSENTIRISRLPYGKQTLSIKGQTSGGQWSAKELTINISVIKPFYLRIWFLLLAGALAITTISLYFLARTRQLRERQTELERIVADRTRQIRDDKLTIELQAEELKSLEKLKSNFFANVSHELRTPLSLIVGPIASLLKRNYLPIEDQKLLKFMQRNAKQLLKLVNEILDLSKLETARLELKTTSVNLMQFLQPLVAQFSSYGDSNKIKLSFEYFADPKLNIFIDAQKFEKIVHNLLSNAMKFTPQGGNVALILDDLGDSLLLKVSDTGSGIHPDDLPYIFDRFYQSKQPDAPVKDGTGIGLSLCIELAQLLNGKIWVESNWGQGSTFYFQFPKLTAPANAVTHIEIHEEIVMAHKNNGHEKTAPNLPTEADTYKPTVLIVEDNPDLHEYMQFIMEDKYLVIHAENGREAWEMLNAGNSLPNLIVSDIMMPVMDGLQLLEKIKSKDQLRHIPVIMLTARADIKVKLKALRIGVDDYLTKPFEEEELLARIHNLLDHYFERMSHFNAQKAKSAETELAEKPVIGIADAQWLEEVEQVFTHYLNEPQFTMDWAASKLNLSLRQFSRRIKQLTGLPPHQYLRELRLQLAKEYLLLGEYITIKEIAAAVGFNDTKHFSLQFQKRFGVTPSAYASE